MKLNVKRELPLAALSLLFMVGYGVVALFFSHTDIQPFHVYEVLLQIFPFIVLTVLSIVAKKCVSIPAVFIMQAILAAFGIAGVAVEGLGFCYFESLTWAYDTVGAYKLFIVTNCIIVFLAMFITPFMPHIAKYYTSVWAVFFSIAGLCALLLFLMTFNVYDLKDALHILAITTAALSLNIFAFTCPEFEALEDVDFEEEDE